MSTTMNTPPLDIYIFNGPPRCGKDTAAKFLAEHTQCWGVSSTISKPEIHRMSDPIKAAFRAAITEQIAKPSAEAYDWEANKDIPHPLLNGLSYRQWQIRFSENFMKPNFGDDIFGKLFTERLTNRFCQPYEAFPATVLVPDGGFQVEIDYLFHHTNWHIHIVQIYRTGCDFSNDSRGYITTPEDLPYDVERRVSLHKVTNNQGVGRFCGTIADLVMSEMEYTNRRFAGPF